MIGQRFARPMFIDAGLSNMRLTLAVFALLEAGPAFGQMDMRYTKPNGAVSSDPTQVYGPLGSMTGAEKAGRNAVYGSVYNDTPRGTAAFPTAMTGHCELHSIGGTCFAGYFEAKGYTPGVVTTEIDAFNQGSVDAPSAYPWARSFGISYPLPIAITCGAGGPKKAGACMEIAREGSTNGQFQFGIVVQKDAVLQAGIVMDADATTGVRNNLVLRNTGSNGAVPIVLQTTGPDNAAPTIAHQRQDGAVNWRIGNDGAADFSNFLAVSHGASPDIRWHNLSAKADEKNWSAWTNRGGDWILRAVNDAYSSAVTALTFRRRGERPTVAQFGVPVQLAVVKVSDLPPCDIALKGAMMAVSDAANPTYRGKLAGGGDDVVPAFCDGGAWRAH